MKLFLDGNDWQAGYFLPEKLYAGNPPRMIDNMLMDSVRSAGMAAAAVNTQGLMKATIPGCDRTVLLENGEISDPYFGRNLERSGWSEKAEWVFRKKFTLPEEWKQCRRIALKFHSAGYRAAIFLNDEFLGVKEGMFHAWEFDVSSDIRRDAENTLVLIFDPAPEASANHFKDRPADFAYYHYCQMSFGWDWSRRMVVSGIFDHVELHGTQTARVKDCAFVTTGRHAALTAEFAALEDCETSVLVKLTDRSGKEIFNARYPISLAVGKENIFTWEFDCPEAEMWYPNGYGAQPLYTLSLQLPGDEKTCLVGFRDLKMLRNPESPEDAYPLTFEVNGERIFARGLNWVPADMIFSRINGETYERQVRLAKEANFNLIRVWGGGLIEKDEFYAACSKYGILVWQEFPHACSKYPSDGDFAVHKAREGEMIIRKLRNYPAMALFCGGNEMLYYGETPDNPVYVKYGEMVRKLAPALDYHIASPDLSRSGERPHGPWCLMEHKFWNSHRRLLASELGCSGWAECDSIERFIPAGDPCPNGQHWKYHFTMDYPGRSLEDLWKIFRLKNGSVRQMCDATMFAQADQLGYAMEHYRTEFPRSSGCFIWQYNESWPTNSYSIIDFYTRPKMAYYRLARSNSPAILFVEDDSWCLENNILNCKLKLVCDQKSAGDMEISFIACDITGRVLCQKNITGSYPAGVTELTEIRENIPAVPGNLIITFQRIFCSGRKIYDNERIYGVPDLSDALLLPTADLTASIDYAQANDGEKICRITVSNTGKTAALHIRADLPELPLEKVFWLDNYRTVMPGESVVFTAYITAEIPSDTQVLLRGWNA